MKKLYEISQTYLAKIKGFFKGISTFIMTIYPFIITAIILAIVIIPIYLLKRYFKKDNKTIKIFPKIEIVSVETANTLDIPLTEQVIQTANDILNKIQKPAK